MSICPECGKEIDTLCFVTSGSRSQIVTYSSGEYLDYDDDEFNVDDDVYQYECLECGNVLFHTEEEVIRFLKNEVKVNKKRGKVKWRIK